MYKLKYNGIKLPNIWVCECRRDTNIAREKGIPFLVKPKGWTDENIIKAVLWYWLVKKFPWIKWDEIYADEPKETLIVNVPSEYRETHEWTDGNPNNEMQVSNDYRPSAGGITEDVDILQHKQVPAKEFFKPWDIDVDIEVLQKLKLLPQFMDDIASAIKSNLYATTWMDGWNKKLNCNLGKYQGSNQAPNLIILDTSGSIPTGVAYTMLSLVDTLRQQCNADLIITSGYSKYWKLSEELPTPEELSSLVGGRNEAYQFYKILDNYVLGRHWGNVIIFGDNDAPSDERFSADQYSKPESTKLTATRIDNLMSFHTYAKRTPGYGLWVKECQVRVPEKFNTSWVKTMRR